MSEPARPDPTLADTADAVEVYSHEHAGPGGADRVAIYRHSGGDYLCREWGVDPDHGDYDRIRWVSAEEGPALIEATRASDLLRYPEPAEASLGATLVFGLSILLLAAGLVTFLARIVLGALEKAG